jgi:hypothetical protein
VVAAGGVAAALTLSADAHQRVVGVLCLAAVVLLALAVAAGFPSLIPWPLVLLAAAYALSLGGGAVDAWAPLYAGGFVAIAELAYWSLELRGRTQDAERLVERRAGLIVTLAIGAVALGGLVLAATSLQIGSGIAIDIVGVTAAIGALVVLAALARPPG